MKRLNSVGASHVAFIAAVLVVLAVGFAGYRVSGTKHSATPANNTATTQPAKYKSVNDVKSADTQLNNVNVDKSLDSSSLDSDLNDLL